ncbi:Hypothetical protein CINCED_3A022053 [Cinara cedri]|uniref:Uncharacterized protein n=1 Tax=Cinara cedri TaxID=506608 RepID=A0A5E4LZR1_9HEMI|nr:Hypothetical protein CINCED_3A022053 [Cinara cedri]
MEWRDLRCLSYVTKASSSTKSNEYVYTKSAHLVSSSFELRLAVYGVFGVLCTSSQHGESWNKEAHYKFAFAFKHGLQKLIIQYNKHSAMKLRLVQLIRGGSDLKTVKGLWVTMNKMKGNQQLFKTKMFRKCVRRCSVFITSGKNPE